MYKVDIIPSRTVDPCFKARLSVELEDLKSLTGEEVHRYGSSIMDKNMLIHEIEKAVERNWTREEFWEKLRSLTLAIANFAEQVLILCRPLDPNYLVNDSCEDRLSK